MRSISTILLFISLSPVLVTSLIPSLNDDVLGLIVFKADIQDPTGKLASWNEEDDSPCNWVGVKCNSRSNRVSELSLEGFSLSGKLSKGLLQLQFLRKLSLARNNLTGSLSISLPQLPDLKFLDLSENSISGYIPSDFFLQCGSLRSISLAENAFSGQIPESLSSCLSLVSLNFSRNQLSGSLPLGLWSLSGLRSLDLSNNLLEDQVPEGINRLNSLRALNLRNNRFTGEVPGGIGRCFLLRSIDLSQNSFHGLLPSTMSRLSLCNNLVLGRNKFTAEMPVWIGEMMSIEFLDLSSNNFSGNIPASLGKLQSLKVLNVSHNALSGSVPETIGNCVNLLVLDLSHNSLASRLPSWLFKIGVQQVQISNNGFSGSLDFVFTSSMENSKEKLLVLDVSNNKLSGEIPSSVGDLSSLHSLNMAKNLFIGSIPLNFGHLESLGFLDLSDNGLNGSIPSSIGDCLALVSLFLARNQLTGPIPGSLAKLTHLADADLSSNKLTGTLPKQLTDLVNLKLFNISHNELQGELPGGAFFDTINPWSVSQNPSLCGAAVKRSCPTVLPKPLVLNPNSTDATPGSTGPAFGAGKKILSISALIAIGAAASIVVGVVGITILNLHARPVVSNSAAPLNFSGGDDFSRSTPTEGESGKLVMFSGDPDFRATTHSLLNKDCELGRGGFGAVYKTMLGSGRPVAIKKLNVSSIVKSQHDFEREVRILGKIRHSNLVALNGYYWTPSLQLLIYEYVSGGNLYKHLHEESELGYLPWNERFNIILGASRGLAHLHQMNIIHYNIKSSNILIDSKGEAKVADYGLAKLLPMVDRYVLSSKIQCALGYMAPEFACNTIKITEKCDVYGFGILILEIVSGKRPVEYMEDDVVVLSDMIRGALDDGKIEECVDSRLQGKFPIDSVIHVVKLALVCISHVPSNRPQMNEVVKMLESMNCSTSVSPGESPHSSNC